MKKLFSILLFAISLNAGAQYLKKQITDLDQIPKKRGTEYGSVFSQTGFADIDTFTYSGSGVTPVVSNGMILLGDGSSTGSILYLPYITSADYWTKESCFKVGEIDGDSYSYSCGLESINGGFRQDLDFQVLHRSTAGYDGVLNITSFNGITSTVIEASLTKLSLTQGDSVAVRVKREGNLFGFWARNVTTGTAEVFVQHRFAFNEIAPNTAKPFDAAVGKDSLYYTSFALNESIGCDLLILGDSKWTWYGTTYNESEPNIYYGATGANIVNHGKSGDKTSEVWAAIKENVSLRARQALWNIGNDIRAGVSTGTWQANIDSVYNNLTRNGTDVFFTLMYETDVDQTPYITYIQAKYPGRLILNGYYATRDCSSCLMADGIHLTAYGKKRHAEADLNAGVLDFNNQTYNIKFTVDSTLAGDSILTKRRYDETREIKMWINGARMFEVDSFRINSIRRTHDSIIVQGSPFDIGDDIVIESYPKNNWTVIPPDPPTFKFLLDIVTTAEVAYSVRKLRAGYSGSCLKVRRSNDNAEQDIGFLNNELDTVAMKVFVGSNSAYVTKWYNQANTDFNSDAVQATSGNQPRIMSSGVIDRINGMVAVKFDGTDDDLGFSDETIASGSAWSAFAVQKRSSTGVASGVFGTDACCVSSPYYYTDDKIYMQAQGGSNSWYNVSSSADATATYSLVSGFQTSTTSTPSLSIYKNGSAITMAGNTDQGFSGNGILNKIGRITSSTYSNFYLSEAILYKSDKTSNRTTAETNINNFFSIY